MIFMLYKAKITYTKNFWKGGTGSAPGIQDSQKGGNKYIVVNMIIVWGAHNLACKCPPRKFWKIKPSEIESEGTFNDLLLLLFQNSTGA